MYRRITAADRDWHAGFFAFVARNFPTLPAAAWQCWDDRGGWDDSYEVFARIEDGEIIGTVGRTRMALAVDGAPVTGFQLGAVATLAERRDQGCGRALMDWVLAETDGPVLLFSNPRATGFYARLGFRAVAQARAGAQVVGWAPGEPAPCIDPADPTERARLSALCARAVPAGGRLSARDYFGVALWHLSCAGQEASWLPEFDAVVAASQTGRRLVVHDVFAPRPFDLRAALPRLARGPVDEAVLLFDPAAWWPGATPLADGSDTTLFVRGPIAGPVMFPGLAHA